MKNIENFKRVEKKYLMTPLQYLKLKEKIGDKMRQGEYGTYTIGNIYYDTPEYSLIRTSLDKPLYKEKIRMRCYGMPSEQSSVFIEIKKKYDGIVYKRRISMPLKEAKKYLNNHIAVSEPSQIQREIDWVLNIYDPVPKVFIGYDRVELFSIDNPELRITFDRNLRWRTTSLDLEAGTWGSPLLDNDDILMEIKIPGSMPLWLSHALSELKIFPKSFSKYGACYKKFLCKESLLSYEPAELGSTIHIFDNIHQPESAQTHSLLSASHQEVKKYA